MKEVEKQLIRKFELENPKFVKNKLTQLFLEEPNIKSLYEQVILNPNAENIRKIDIAFKRFYLKLRFVTHMSNTLFYNSVNYDKRSRLLNSRFSLLLDAPLKDEEETTYLDLLTNEAYLNDDEILEKGSLKDIVVNEELYNALNRLTKNQLMVLNLAYVEMLNDTEIAKKLRKSQQAISKTHKQALKKLAQYLIEVGE